MPTLTGPARLRIHSIDILRGIIMVIMALDHTRDFFYKASIDGGASVATNPTDLATTTPALFFTRWITHFCAPLFLFLAGVSIRLLAEKKTKAELSSFLIKRGIWLVLLEIVVITLGWTFNPLFNVIILQVIWAIGISMIIMGLLIRLPIVVLAVIGIVIVFAHNLMDYPSISAGVKGSIFGDLVYFSQFRFFSWAPQYFVLIVYAFLPWTGVMILGYCFGKVFTPSFDYVARKKMLLGTGLGLVALFLILRLINQYGDPVPWSTQPRGAIFSFLSFLNLNKYPPSLDFLSLFIGVGLIALYFLEGVRGRLSEFFRVYGRVPLFFYILHFYLLHLIVVVVFFVQGFGIDQIRTPQNPFLFRPSAFGTGLLGVYAVWILVFLLLYPLCKKYDNYKSTHKKWWLSYL